MVRPRKRPSGHANLWPREHHQEEPVSHPRLSTPEETLADAKKRLNLPRIVPATEPTRALRALHVP
ncbi:hypothetical protein C4J65_19425 [Streptomyces sp. CB09001]|nr:hypothetical protein C4J65_19425 [Streptomyces sp. CB09001]